MAFGLPQQYAGKLDRRIALMRRTTSYNAANEPIETYASVATMWANVQHHSVKEMNEASAVRASKNTRFLVRYRTDITEMDRIRHDSKDYAIVGITEMGRREMLEIMGEYLEGRA